MFQKNSLIFCSPPVVESYHSRNLNIGQCWQGGTTVTFCGWSYSNIFKQTLVINQFSRCPWHISVVRIIYLTSEIRLDKIGFNGFGWVQTTCPSGLLGENKWTGAMSSAKTQAACQGHWPGCQSGPRPHRQYFE